MSHLSQEVSFPYDFSPLVLGLVMLKLETSRTNHRNGVLLYTVSFGGSMLLTF